jgi:hypothetical protein
VTGCAARAGSAGRCAPLRLPCPTGAGITACMYEHRTEPLLSRREYSQRLFRHALAAAGVGGVCLGIGMCGYHAFESLPWIDAFTNAAMILSGMGPLATPQTAAGKLFAGFYALFSGVAFLTTVGVLLAPVAHRFLHRFHVERREPRA